MITARQIITKHLAIITLIFIIGAYLVIKAVPENSWDGFKVGSIFGSAQPMLSNKHWVNDGFLKNYLLDIPLGYSKVVRYFDEPELRQHAHGTISGGLIGQRLYYTHYPPGYLIPTAILMKLGFENRFWPRFLEILFSLGGLVFLYWFFNMIAGRLIAFLGTLFYAISIVFLDFADSLTNQPIDDLLRLAVIALSVFTIKSGKKNFNYLIWTLYFVLSFSSYDSTFFVFVWLVGLDLIIERKFRWKKWAFWASAPILAFAVQLFQNTLYLGWHDMIMDFYGAFNVQLLGAKHGDLQLGGSRNSFFISHIIRFFEPFGGFFGIHWYLNTLTAPGHILSYGFFEKICSTAKFSAKYLLLTKWFLDILVISGGILSFWFVEKVYQPIKINTNMKYLILMILAAIFNFLLFSPLFLYQSRMLTAFGSFLTAGLTVMTIKILYAGKGLKLNLKILISAILLITLGLWFVQTARTYNYLKHWLDTNTWPIAKIEFDKKIKNLLPDDKIVFDIHDSNRETLSNAVDEYYMGNLILNFTTINDLVRDLIYLKKRSEFPFGSIIIADRKETSEKIRTSLTQKLNKKISSTKLDGKFILIIPE